MRKLKLEELNRIGIEEFKHIKKIPLVVMLDNVRSMLNVGSAFRTSDAFRIEKVILCGITAKPPHREINKTALGSTESVEWEYYKDSSQAATDLKEKGYRLMAIEQAEESTFLQNFQPDEREKYCFIFGNEVYGVSETLMNVVDDCLEIPQFGTKHSLNISVSVGVLIWDFYQKMYLKK